MFSGLTPTSRQRRFCEGFLFFPIKHLRKYGHFIFRQYGGHAGVKSLLDMKLGALDFNTRYAESIQQCITEEAAPKALRVLDKMEAAYARMQAAGAPVTGVYQDFNELFIHYYREVMVYHNVVLRNLKEELKPVLKPKITDGTTAVAGYDHIHKVAKLVKEFLIQSKTILTLLDDFVEKENNFPAAYSHKEIVLLVNDIRQLYFTQKDLVQLLKSWARDKDIHGLQTYYN
ncbi:hypothetical protein FHW36_11628 [Chitinophaga polysaccharea]|uniref:Uncharacterized protein n=1 Tax=Chitinophaga polysaccharea TaxID=1293035 RepID=A0A561P2M9_9BACT|nr:hypothetical protein [Chitinophaga polysaccharea]TWF32355.1 hypothetical protein FHW36_11628 [Chitinophaga polysaccharea]